MNLARRPRRAQGYTLMELGVVLVLTVLMVFGMVRWLVSVGYSARTGIENAADQRISLVLDTLDDDMLGLRHCRGDGSDARIVELDDDSMTIISDPDGDGVVETVSWRLQGDSVERGVAPVGADCSPGTVTAWTPWAQNVDTFVLRLIRNGAEDPIGTAGVCPDEYSVRCTPAPLQVRIGVNESEAKRVYGH